MRLRHKKHLNERLEKVTNLLRVEKCEPNSLKSAENPKYLHSDEIFGNDYPLTLEIGCGFGSFARQYAAKYPKRNLIAVEKDPNVLVTACELTDNLPNLKYLNICAKYLLTYFPDRSVSEMHLNFSTPFQKESYKKDRLTHRAFLNIYSRILVPGGKLFFKTDNERLFEFTKEELDASGWIISGISENLHESPFNKDNLVTEYENKFSSQGIPIKFILAENPAV